MEPSHVFKAKEIVSEKSSARWSCRRLVGRHDALAAVNELPSAPSRFNCHRVKPQAVLAKPCTSIQEPRRALLDQSSGQEKPKASLLCNVHAWVMDATRIFGPQYPEFRFSCPALSNVGHASPFAEASTVDQHLAWKV